MADRDTSPTSTTSARSTITVLTAKHAGSRSSISASPPHSTPPTSLGDEASIMSDAAKMESLVETLGEASALQAHAEAQATPQPTPASAPASEGRRSIRSSRASVTTYNVQMLAGTAIHTPTKYLEKHHKNVLHGPIEAVLKTNTTTSPKKRGGKLGSEDTNDPVEQQLVTEAAQAAQRRKSTRGVDLRKEALRNLSAVTDVASMVAQKGQDILLGGKDKLQSALRRTKSEPSLAARSMSRASSKRARGARFAESEDEEDDDEDEDESDKDYVKPKTKKWLQQGLYVGQHREFDARLSESQNRARRRSVKAKERTILPLPMFAGDRLLNSDPKTVWRNFKLPFDTYHPLPRKVKVDGWVKLHKNRFIGDASALWKRDKQDSSQCYCLPEDGCGDSCHNRIMAYECDSTNCRLTPEQCRNRPFAQLKKRAKGNGYDYGVEVMETEGKGYGVRAMRSFEPHQIIVEYAGEIITQQECEERMKKIYKKDKCYYLMSFDNKMIIDATRGTIARFVNHSCEPNCEMIKWTVSGEPRMALFAGSRGIMSGEELTYDYNFDPFSTRNVQECRCGTRSCRGVLGPKPKQQPQNLASSLIAGTKRKLKEVLGSTQRTGSAPNSPKKRKLSSIASSTLTKAKNAVTEAAAVRERAERDAADHAAQLASRENRALRRSASMTLSSRRSRLLRKGSRHSLPIVKTTRKTTVSLKRTNPKASALKPISKPSRLANIVKRNAQLVKDKKCRVVPSAKVPRTPKANIAPKSESESEDDSPNITPASLRSATRAASSRKRYTQTKLSFQPAARKVRSQTPMSDTDMEFPVSDDEDLVQVEFGASPGRGRGRPKKNNTDTLRKTGAGVKKTMNRSIRATKRAVGVAHAMGRQGVRGGTIRVIAAEN